LIALIQQSGDFFMSVLSDTRILAKIYSKEFQIDPCQVDNIQPSSIDLTLDKDIKIPKKNIRINPPYPDMEEMRKYFEEATLTGDYILGPGEFILGQIRETVGLSDRLVGNIQNRNSLIRLGINVGLSTYINPGYRGKLPIAIHNIGEFDCKLVPGMRICQLVLSETEGVLRDYSKRESAKYHAEEEITLSKLSQDKEFVEYVRKFGGESDTGKLIEFLDRRIKEKSKDFFNQLDPAQKKALGLA
jgi:dCTP deaminase